MGDVLLSQIKDGGAQMRIEMNADTVNDYAEDMVAGAVFPAVVVFFDGEDHWLGDGFHRVEAARKIERESIEADVRKGTKRDAYLGLIPFDGLVDRRNDEPMIFEVNAELAPDEEREVSCDLYDASTGLSVPDMPVLPSLGVEMLDSAAVRQDFIVEVWVEKSTQNDWLVPLCKRRGVNLVVGLGEQSETRSRELAFRCAEYAVPARIIYLSDLDPGGRSMPKAVARKAEFTIAKHELDVDLQVIPLALTPEQCRAYDLPLERSLKRT
jgi:hypothetical protein